MKMLTTQISGLLQRIIGNNEDSIEETARLLAQATIGEGRVILACFGEMKAVGLVAVEGVDKLVGAVPYEQGMNIGSQDRVWILTRTARDEAALSLARILDDEFIPFAAVSSGSADDNELAELATTYISTGLTRGLLPGEDGNRIVEPQALAGLFIYEAVKISYDEMVLED
ncbi:DUF2529 family protein [Sporosarcina sp. Marseille-Q4063]|uniref:DUF2529 family protein n=1 Tax=Sporosarcina sp. Marseille-Q4063 TaxID=2810514 RepID=UPI001BAF3870|nr:DUF2529 family protein [Sporosarcina sp. Marseille-Q4063]QUW21148.1 DUF2529 family protein [Sporosarcina sp. Marseille-Q4063]